jgi:hypothetical protein
MVNSFDPPIGRTHRAPPCPVAETTNTARGTTRRPKHWTVSLPDRTEAIAIAVRTGDFEALRQLHQGKLGANQAEGQFRRCQMTSPLSSPVRRDHLVAGVNLTNRGR